MICHKNIQRPNPVVLILGFARTHRAASLLVLPPPLDETAPHSLVSKWYIRDEWRSGCSRKAYLLPLHYAGRHATSAAAFPSSASACLQKDKACRAVLPGGSDTYLQSATAAGWNCTHTSVFRRKVRVKQERAVCIMWKLKLTAWFHPMVEAAVTTPW